MPDRCPVCKTKLKKSSSTERYNEHGKLIEKLVEWYCPKCEKYE